MSHIDVGGGSGSGGTPSDTVVEELALDQNSDAGVATEYSRGDHTHGTPTGASGVTTEVDYNQAPDAGVSVEPSRGDHTHGTPDHDSYTELYDLPTLYNFVDNETPTGTIDGTNDTFTLAFVPVPDTSTHVYKNGIRQQLVP